MADTVFTITFPESYKDRIEAAFLALSESKSEVIGRYGTYTLQFPKKNGQTIDEYLQECIALSIKSIVEFSEDSLELKSYSESIEKVKKPKKSNIPSDIVDVQRNP